MMKYKETIEVLILALFFTFGSWVVVQVSGDVQEGLVAYFKFDEGKGKMLTDSSGLGNDADIKGNVDWVEGKYDKGLKFDGKASYAEISPGTVGTFESVTMTAWVKVEKMPSTNSYNICGMSSGAGMGFYLELYNVNLAAWQCGPNMNASLPYVATFSEWHHVAAVYTGQEIRLYIDGQEKAKKPGTALPIVTAMPFRISGDHSEVNTWGGSLDGVIDEVRLYNRALGADEIKEAMEPDKGTAVTPLGRLSTTWGKAKY
jgi:hypothetical protein